MVVNLDLFGQDSLMSWIDFVAMIKISKNLFEDVNQGISLPGNATDVAIKKNRFKNVKTAINLIGVEPVSGDSRKTHLEWTLVGLAALAVAILQLLHDLAF